MEEFKERYKLIKCIESNKYLSTYTGYDKLKKEYCYIEIPTIKTSWNYNVITNN